MSSETLFDKVWDLHTVRVLPNGQTQLFIGLHLIHEVTSPQAFQMLRDQGLKVPYPKLAFATADHIVPTLRSQLIRPFQDATADEMLTAIEKNCREFGIKFFGLGDENQGIVHVIGPELGLTQPGKTIACGDSHTATHGAFGAVAFGIGTTQVKDVLASQCLLLDRPKVRLIKVNGALQRGVYAKDIILKVIGRLGAKGGIGYAYEYGGEVIAALDMEGRMTVCNMSIEGGATCGLVNPDQKTIDYLAGRPYVPKGADFTSRSQDWLSLQSASDASYDDIAEFNGNEIVPMATWGTSPDQVIGIDEAIPSDADEKALRYMGFRAGQKIAGTKVDVAFIGSCTNGRMTDLREAATIITKHKLHVAKHVRAMIVPGSEKVRRQAEILGLHEVFQEAGFEWRNAGCSMCLGMNPDQVGKEQISVSSSNRNFEGRQGPGARTVLMSPASVVASAAAGEIADVRQLN